MISMYFATFGDTKIVPGLILSTTYTSYLFFAEGL